MCFVKSIIKINFSELIHYYDKYFQIHPNQIFHLESGLVNIAKMTVSR